MSATSRKRRIAFISPRGTERNQQNPVLFDVYRKLMPVMSFMIDDIEFIPNLGLLAVAGYLDDTWDAVYLDEDYIDEATADAIIFSEPYDVVALSACDNQALRAYEIADRFRSGGVYVVMGGFHPSALPDEAKEHCDTVFIGEGEDTFPQFIEDFKSNSPKPFYRSHGKGDLTQFPPPRYDIISSFARFNKMPVFATRGCPHDCAYCCIKRLYGPKYRTKRVEQVVREIEAVKALSPKPHPFITFGDENLLADRAWSKELLRALAPLRVPWECYCDSSVADDDELLELLYRSHCAELLIGFETVDARNFAGTSPWKAKQVARYRDAVRKIQSHGVGVMGLFMVGFDHDTPAVFDELLQFIRDSELFDVDFAVLCPIPGTPVFDAMEREGRILTRNWNRYTWLHVNYRPKGMTPAQLQEGLIRLFTEFSTVQELEKRRRYFKDLYRRLSSA